MSTYVFLVVDPGGAVRDRATSVCAEIDEVVAHGFEIARQVKRRAHGKSDTWLVEILDGAGDHVMSLPFAMVSR